MSNDTHSVAATDFSRRSSLLFIALSGFFVANAMVAEFIGVKVFSLEKTLGMDPLDYQMLGFTIALNFSAGAILWPLEFAITDTLNEYFGSRGVKILSYMTIGLISYAFLMVLMAMSLTPADIWMTRNTPDGPINMTLAFDTIFGQGLWIIIGSLVAFLLGQLVDVSIFHRVKTYTGEKYLWLRATGSTVVSQLVDSFVVILIAFYFNPSTNWPLDFVLVMGAVKYLYKFVMALALTPVLYLLHIWIDNYLGEPLATEMKKRAMESSKNNWFSKYPLIPD